MRKLKQTIISTSSIILITAFIICADSRSIALENQAKDSSMQLSANEVEEIFYEELGTVKASAVLKEIEKDELVVEEIEEEETTEAIEETTITIEETEETEEETTVIKETETETIIVEETETIAEETETETENVEEETITTVTNISLNDLRYMSAIIYAEAANQCVAGQQAVGIIVMNRSTSSDFANGVYNVIYESGQFTPVRDGSLNRALSLYDSGSIPNSCIEAAKYALQGNKTVCYNGTTYDLSSYYYFSRYVSNARLIIEDHMFK